MLSSTPVLVPPVVTAERTAQPYPPSWLPPGHGNQGETIREGRQNIRIWMPSMLTGVRQTSVQLGGSSAVAAASDYDAA
jgi:hypothetical protein